MRILLDESLPRKLALELTGHETQTVQKKARRVLAALLRTGWTLKRQSGSHKTLYQTLINDALRSHLRLADPPVTQELVRKIVREELAAHS